MSRTARSRARLPLGIRCNQNREMALIHRNYEPVTSNFNKLLAEFLRSNELWGGAGSIADQPLTSLFRAHLLEKLLRLALDNLHRIA